MGFHGSWRLHHCIGISLLMKSFSWSWCRLANEVLILVMVSSGSWSLHPCLAVFWFSKYAFSSRRLLRFTKSLSLFLMSSKTRSCLVSHYSRVFILMLGYPALGSPDYIGHYPGLGLSLFMKTFIIVLVAPRWCSLSHPCLCVSRFIDVFNRVFWFILVCILATGSSDSRSPYLFLVISWFNKSSSLSRCLPPGSWTPHTSNVFCWFMKSLSWFLWLHVFVLARVSPDLWLSTLLSWFL